MVKCGWVKNGGTCILEQENQELKNSLERYQKELNEENLQCSKYAIEINDLKEQLEEHNLAIENLAYWKGKNESKMKINRLRKENQELKKQLEEMDSKLFFTKNELEMRQKSIDNKLRQQKEFIEWLEEKIKNYELPLTDENKKALGYTLPMKGMYKEILEKYKEIVGDKNEIQDE